eukprot:COSAG05_NODE_872_length_6839_cov_16.232938_9_plen_31_part_01
MPCQAARTHEHLQRVFVRRETLRIRWGQLSM